jgi:ubiquinone/menaquinone biosynthesis C-methylase UbiE
VLDIGCGAGAYVEPTLARLTAEAHLLAADQSMGMLRDVASRPIAHRVSLLNADAMYIPLPDSCCIVVLANHMLYHVPRIEQALAESRRVLSPGGYLVAATNARNSMETFVLEVEAACKALGYPITVPPSPARTRFTLENGGALIESFFANVQRDIVDSDLVFPEAAPAVAYIHSLRHAYAPQLPKGLSWEALMKQIERQIESKVAARGEYRVPKTTGVFVAVKGD